MASTGMEHGDQVLNARRVFGEPIESKEGVVLLPVAKLRGGAGSGHGPAREGQGEPGGGGFGMRAMPAGVYVLAGGRLRWRPAVDVNRVILGGQLVAICALLTVGLSRLVRRRRFRLR